MVLKKDKLRDKERKIEIEGLLGSVAEERFALLVNLGKKITDWGAHEDKGQGGGYNYSSCCILKILHVVLQTWANVLTCTIITLGYNIFSSCHWLVGVGCHLCYCSLTLRVE